MSGYRSPTLRKLDSERQKAKNEAERAEIRERYADYEPPDVRTYGISPSGIDYDAAIQAAAEFSVPRPTSPNRGTRR